MRYLIFYDFIPPKRNLEIPFLAGIFWFVPCYNYYFNHAFDWSDGLRMVSVKSNVIPTERCKIMKCFQSAILFHFKNVQKKTMEHAAVGDQCLLGGN